MTILKNPLSAACTNERKLETNSSELFQILEQPFKQLQQTKNSHRNCIHIMWVWPIEKQTKIQHAVPLCLDLQVLLQLYRKKKKRAHGLSAKSQLSEPSTFCSTGNHDYRCITMRSFGPKTSIMLYKARISSLS